MFLSELELRYCTVDDRWRLQEDLVYHGQKDLFHVHRGFGTDLASVPRILWPFIPPFGRYMRAAVVHDYLYLTHKFSRKDADGIFRRIMKEEGVGWLRWPMYWAVRAFGWIYWR